jgi:hypothetical protein
VPTEEEEEKEEEVILCIKKNMSYYSLQIKTAPAEFNSFMCTYYIL